jgi:NADPH-dependent curcumin reductase CurA
MRSREWRLAARPKGWPEPTDFELAERDVPGPAAGQVLVRNEFFSVDPYMRGRMNDARSYAAPYQVGKVMYGGAVGRVVESAADTLPVGTLVRTNRGWREAFVCAASEPERLPEHGAPPQAYLGVLGMPGLTAWVGIFDIGETRPGETVFVSAAAGAVGSLAGQLAKLAGCRVIGSAGSAEKVDYLRELGYDAAFDYTAGDVRGQLAAAAPDGIDVYFDNVGGDHLAAALDRLRVNGRVIACGMISRYNEAGAMPDNLANIVGKRLRIQGYIISDHSHRQELFVRHVSGLLADGRIRYRESIVDGIENAPAAFLGMLRGRDAHVGKLVINVGAPA